VLQCVTITEHILAVAEECIGESLYVRVNGRVCMCVYVFVCEKERARARARAR